MTAAEFAQLRLVGTSQHPPTLEQALRLVDGRVPVLVEVKDSDPVGPLEDAVARAIFDYDGDLAVMSFNPFTVARFRTASPEVVRGQLAGRLKDEDVAWYERLVLRHLWMNWSSRPDFVAYELNAAPNTDTFLQQLRGRPLLLWTAETTEETARAKSVADNVIADPGGLTTR